MLQQKVTQISICPTVGTSCSSCHTDNIILSSISTQSVSQSISPSINQPINQSINQSTFCVFRTHQRSQQTMLMKFLKMLRLNEISHSMHSHVVTWQLHMLAQPMGQQTLSMQQKLTLWRSVCCVCCKTSTALTASSDCKHRQRAQTASTEIKWSKVVYKRAAVAQGRVIRPGICKC